MPGTPTGPAGTAHATLPGRSPVADRTPLTPLPPLPPKVAIYTPRQTPPPKRSRRRRLVAMLALALFTAGGAVMASRMRIGHPHAPVSVTTPATPTSNTTAPPTHTHLTHQNARRHNAPPPSLSHHLNAALSASGGSSAMTITLVVATDAASPSITLAVAGLHTFTRHVGGAVHDTASFTTRPHSGPNRLTSTARASTSSGTVTTNPQPLEVRE